jgi:hypothetical protein
MDDPSKALQMDFGGMDSGSLASRRLSSGFGSAQSQQQNNQSGAHMRLLPSGGASLQNMSEYVQSAPVMAQPNIMSGFWGQTPTSDNAIYEDTKTEVKTDGAHPMSISVAVQQHQNNEHLAAMSAPTRASDGSFGQGFWDMNQSHHFSNKRKLSETNYPNGPHINEFDSLHNAPNGGSILPSPKKIKTDTTPLGTPHRDTHTTHVWMPTPNNELPPMIATGMPPNMEMMQMGFDMHAMQMGPGFVPGTGPFIAGPNFGMPGFPPNVWHNGFPSATSNMSMSITGSPYFDMDDSIGAPSSRRRRAPNGRRSDLVPKVPRPDKGLGADKWKTLSKKERERARRAELKECYNELSVALDLEAKRSGAQLPDRADIVRSACEEIRRLERSLQSLQGEDAARQQCDSVQEHVKSTFT